MLYYREPWLVRLVVFLDRLACNTRGILPMTAHRITASALIEAPATDLYEILADYHHGHPAILPRPPFEGLVVEEGGVGAGTVIRVDMRVMGRRQTFRALITEPEPGRVLVETNDTGYVTTFTVDPREGGEHALVTIDTEMPGRAGIPGAIEQWFVTRLLRPVYVRELDNLAAVAVQQAM